jgi:nucleotide-binding universal stress UspA family protein
MHDRLVVGFDGSTTSTSAVEWAAAEAERRGAALRVISSYALPPVMDHYGIGTGAASPADVQRADLGARETLEAAMSGCRHHHPALGLDYWTTDAPVVEALTEEARRADLLVVGRSGAGPFERVLLGSVTESVLYRSPCPVAVVPTKTVDHGDAADHVGRVVVGVDGSPAALKAMRWAADEADTRQANLVVVHAWDYPYRMTTEGLAPGSDLARVDAAIVADRAVEEAREMMAGPVTSRLVEASAVQALLDAAETADLLVVGSRGRGGFRTMVLGSVAHVVAGHSPCPVVVVR